MTNRSYISRQFANPRGIVGGIVGLVMAHRLSNRRRYAWVMECLDIQPDDRVLEIGCGPGLGLESVAGKLTTGKIVGVDLSPVMVDQARMRNRAALRAGRVELVQSDMSNLPEIEGGYTKVFAINALQYAHDLNAVACGIADVMAPGGLLAATYQPRRRRPTREAAIAVGDRLAIAFGHAGFSDIRMQEIPNSAAPVVTVLATMAD